MAVAFVNSAKADNSGNYAGTGTSIATPATSLTAGNLLLVFIRSNSGVISSIADTAGNTFTLMPSGHFDTGHGGTIIDVYYAKNVSGNASNVVTCNFTGSVSGRAICILQYSGASTTAPFNGCAPGVYASGTTVTTNPYTTNIATAVVVLFTNQDSGASTWTTPSGFTNRITTAVEILTVYDKITSVVETATQTTITYGTSADKSVIEGSFTADATAATSGGSYAFA